MALHWDGVAAVNTSWVAAAFSPSLTRYLVGASGGGSGRMMSSPDAQNWTDLGALWTTAHFADGYAGLTVGHNGLLWDGGGSQFLGCGVAQKAVSDGNIYLFVTYSADGLTWSRHLVGNLGVNTQTFSIPVIATNGAGTTVITLQTSGTGTRVFSSTDLVTWTEVDPPASMSPGAVLFAGSQWVIVGNGSIPILTATDPAAVNPAPGGWTGQMGFQVGFENTAWCAVAFGSSGYCAVARGVNGAGAVMTSPDAVTWTLQTPPTVSGVFSSAAGWCALVWTVADGFVALNDAGATNASEGSMTSPTGAVWTLVATPDQSPPDDVGGKWPALTYAAALNQYVGAGSAFGGQLFYVITQLPAWYYNPNTNHYQYTVTNPGAPWIAQAPTLSIDCAGISPSSGYTVGGSLITIPGTGFGDGATVTFGGVAATSVTVVDANTITAILPAHAAGAVDVVVTNLDGTTFTCPNGFTYVTPTTIPFTGANLSLTQAQAGPGGTGGGSWVTKECTGKTGSPRTGV